MDSIRFFKLPRNNGDTTWIRNYDYFRGIYHKINTDFETNAIRQFAITKNMIPQNDSSVNINVEFITDGQLPTYNPKLKPYVKTSDDDIQELNFRVYYYGNLDIKVNFIQIVSPNTDTLLFGYYDTDIISKVRENFDYYDGNEYVSHRKILKRIYTRDEHGPEHWISMKYFNDLIGNIGTTETEQVYPEIYRYYTNIAEFWSNTGYPEDAKTSPPFIPYAKSLFRNMGYKWGYKQGNRGMLDTLSSDYETWLIWPYGYSTEIQNLK